MIEKVGIINFIGQINLENIYMIKNEILADDEIYLFFGETNE